MSKHVTNFLSNPNPEITIPMGGNIKNCLTAAKLQSRQANNTSIGSKNQTQNLQAKKKEETKKKSKQQKKQQL